MAMSASHR